MRTNLLATHGRRLALPALLVCLLSTPLAAATLEEALIAAYQTNPDLVARRAQLRATDAGVTEAKAGYLPTLKGSVQYQRQRGSQTLTLDTPPDPASQALFALVDDLDADYPTYTLSLDQNLFQGGGTAASVSRARNRVRSGRSGLVATEQAVLLDAATAYVQVWRDRNALTQAESNLGRLQAQLKKTGRMFDLGEVTRTDVRQAEARLARGQAELDQARANLADSEAYYTRTIGSPPSTVVAPDRLPALPATLEDASIRAEGTPEVQQAMHDLAAAKDDVDVASANLWPSIDLSGQLNRQDDPSTIIQKSETAEIGVKLTVPFYEGGVTLARVRENKETVEQRKSELQGQIRRSQESVQKAWDQLRIARSQMTSFATEARANGLALEGVEREAELGRRTTIDVLDAQQDLFTSNLNEIKARASMVIASYQVKQAIGELTVEGLGLDVAPYDPAINAQREQRRLFGIATLD
jgi:TolC family type I secretion outer membrane protein